MSEVCYDQELARKPALAGRIFVQFAISSAGQVFTSVMQSTSMNDARVENCVSMRQALEFPSRSAGHGHRPLSFSSLRGRLRFFARRRC